jgi:hypothetical protein
MGCFQSSGEDSDLIDVPQRQRKILSRRLLSPLNTANSITTVESSNFLRKAFLRNPIVKSELGVHSNLADNLDYLIDSMTHKTYFADEIIYTQGSQ